MPSTPSQDSPDTLPAEALAALRAGPVVVFTGAGMSAECGIPPFREAQTGLWARFRAEDLATPEAFARDPGTVWDWYEWRRGLVRAAEAHPGYAAVARLEQAVEDLTVVTTVNGVERQRGSAGDMAFPIPDLLAYVSGIMTLEAGDLVATGTPEGVGPLEPGDQVRIQVPGVGAVANPVVSAT